MVGNGNRMFRSWTIEARPPIVQVNDERQAVIHELGTKRTRLISGKRKKGEKEHIEVVLGLKPIGEPGKASRGLRLRKPRAQPNSAC